MAKGTRSCYWKFREGNKADSRDIPEGLGELKRFVDDAFALFVVTEFGVALFRVSLYGKKSGGREAHSDREVFPQWVALET